MINSLRCFRDNRKELSYIKTHVLGVVDVQSAQIYGLSVDQICTFSVVRSFPYEAHHLALVNPKVLSSSLKTDQAEETEGVEGLSISNRS